nr:hypothetical protein [Cellulomonas sp.]
MTTITPYLTVHDGRAALEFYAAAFGAIETGERHEEDGRIGFAMLTIDGAPLYLSDERTSTARGRRAAWGTRRRRSRWPWRTSTRRTSGP